MTMRPRQSDLGGLAATHRWDGAVYRAFPQSGMPDLFPPSDAGLVDPTGRRYDEPAPARLQSVETSRVCLACQQSSTGRCSAHGGEAH